MDTDSKAPDVSGEANQDGNAENKGQSQSAESAVSESSIPSPAVAANGTAVVEEIPFHSQYKILDDAMAAPTNAETGRAYVHPVLFDCLLACGLLVAMGGFTIGLLKIYITHSAEQSIMQHNYKAAIEILKGAPFPGLFTVIQSKGRDPQELLNQALYLDSMEKLDANGEDQSAIRELTQIQPGSRYFELAQEAVKEHTVPSSVQLEGQAQHQASPTDKVPEENTPIIPEAKEND